MRGGTEWRDGYEDGERFVFHQFSSPTDESDKAGKK